MGCVRARGKFAAGKNRGNTDLRFKKSVTKSEKERDDDLEQ